MPAVRSVFISDVHLGTRACQADSLLAFLREYPARHLYLVGDIIDFWSMSRGIHWSPAQNTVIQKVLRRARHGERVVFVPGNHDEALRDYCETAFGDIRVEREFVHETADGRRLLLIHGDEFDQVTRHHRWVAVLGDVAYNALVGLNGWLSWMRRQRRGEQRTPRDSVSCNRISDFLIPRALAMALYRSPVQACGALTPPFGKGGLG
ncbi:MAG: UDP-2,3-diacylglucosamine diphosphatase, partial [Pseudomonadota bacterium]|nr:UDP-2,3-diacylglucosamine diphosphatase [Pseudomonadota bacterium]